MLRRWPSASTLLNNSQPKAIRFVKHRANRRLTKRIFQVHRFLGSPERLASPLGKRRLAADNRMRPHGGDSLSNAVKARVATPSRQAAKAAWSIHASLLGPARGLSVTKAPAVRVKHVVGKEHRSTSPQQCGELGPVNSSGWCRGPANTNV